jgi:transcriptional regulator GlxA family with amidase domain
VTIAFVLYPGFTALDIIGPFEVLAFVPGHDAVFVAAEPGPVTDDTGRCQLIASTRLNQMTADVVVIGGTFVHQGARPGGGAVAAPGPPRHHLDHRCRTGAIYLAAAGMLDGQDATTHWAWAGELERRGARYTGQRVVETGRVITAAGVSAGIDMARTLLARLHGPQIAQGLQLDIEYDPQPPFDTGSPSKAPAEMVEFVRSQLTTLAAAEPATSG